MGEALFLDPERFVVTDTQIHVLSDKRLTPVNFANFWSPEDNLVADGVLDAPRLLVPPILYTVQDGCLHLMLDFFQNDWFIAEAEPCRVALPVLEERPTHSARSWARLMSEDLGHSLKEEW